MVSTQSRRGGKKEVHKLGVVVFRRVESVSLTAAVNEYFFLGGGLEVSTSLRAYLIVVLVVVLSWFFGRRGGF